MYAAVSGLYILTLTVLLYPRNTARIQRLLGSIGLTQSEALREQMGTAAAAMMQGGRPDAARTVSCAFFNPRAWADVFCDRSEEPAWIEEAFSQVAERFRSIEVAKLTAESVKLRETLYASAKSIEHYSDCDAFVSHAHLDHHDDDSSPELKNKITKLREWASEREVRWRKNHRDEHSGRGARVWLDLACLEPTSSAFKKQGATNQDLVALSVYLSCVPELIMLIGDHYSQRLWCVVELFTFLVMQQLDAPGVRSSGLGEGGQLGLAWKEVPYRAHADLISDRLSEDLNNQLSEKLQTARIEFTPAELEAFGIVNPQAGDCICIASESCRLFFEPDVLQVTIKHIGKSSGSGDALSRLQDAFLQFDVNQTQARHGPDEGRLKSIIQTGFGTLEQFNAHVRQILKIKDEGMTQRPLRQLECFRAHDARDGAEAIASKYEWEHGQREFESKRSEINYYDVREIIYWLRPPSVRAPSETTGNACGDVARVKLLKSSWLCERAERMRQFRMRRISESLDVLKPDESAPDLFDEMRRFSRMRQLSVGLRALKAEEPTKDLDLPTVGDFLEYVGEYLQYEPAEAGSKDDDNAKEPKFPDVEEGKNNDIASALADAKRKYEEEHPLPPDQSERIEAAKASVKAFVAKQPTFEQLTALRSRLSEELAELVLPCRQDLEECDHHMGRPAADADSAYLTVDEFMELNHSTMPAGDGLKDDDWRECYALPIVCVSYAWETQDHPDPFGKTLIKVADALEGSAMSEAVGQVGVFFDVRPAEGSNPRALPRRVLKPVLLIQPLVCRSLVLCSGALCHRIKPGNQGQRHKGGHTGTARQKRMRHSRTRWARCRSGMLTC